MKVIGITGGIGSGKTSVAKIIEEKGFPVYYSDDRAKNLMNTNTIIKKQLSKWYGKDIYNEEGLNKKKLAQIIFNNPDELNKVNHLVHPIVFEDFKNWKKQQTTKFIFKEAAILFESGADKDCDFIITVSAPINLRIERATKRDNTQKKNIEKRITQQWTDAQRENKANFTIHNAGSIEDLKKEVSHLLKKLSEL